MSNPTKIQELLSNSLLEVHQSLFRLGPEYKPEPLSAGRLEREPLSFIIGEHPSEYSVSPLMWNAEFKLRGAEGIFFPADIPTDRRTNLRLLLDLVFESGGKNFRVLTITNPYKIEALEYFSARQKTDPEKIRIDEDARRIGATNQILIGPDEVFHVINSDGRGMVKAVEASLAAKKAGTLQTKRVGIIGAGGAARGIIYEVAKRLNAGHDGKLILFNRTIEKAVTLAKEFSLYFPKVAIEAKPLGDLAVLAKDQDLLISSITEGNPLLELNVYRILPAGMLIIDANYGVNSVLTKDAESAGRDDLIIHDGRGMVVEGYIIPSQTLARLWGYEVPDNIYNTIGALFGYTPNVDPKQP